MGNHRFRQIAVHVPCQQVHPGSDCTHQTDYLCYAWAFRSVDSKLEARFIGVGSHHPRKPLSELGLATARDDVDGIARVRTEAAQHGQGLLRGAAADHALRHKCPIVVQQQQPLLRPARHEPLHAALATHLKVDAQRSGCFADGLAAPMGGFICTSPTWTIRLCSQAAVGAPEAAATSSNDTEALTVLLQVL